MRRPRKGMSLIEVMVAIGIASLLGLIMIQVIFPSFRIVQEGQIRTELQQQGELALQQLTADLQNTVPTGVSLAFPVNPGDGMLVATHPVQQTLGTGSLSFDSMLLVFWHDTTKKQLLRKKFSNGDPSLVTLSFQPFTALQTTRANLEQICNSVNKTEKSYALSVESFNVEKEYTTGGEVYACRILLQKEIPGKNRNAVVELFRKVMLRNHL